MKLQIKPQIKPQIKSKGANAMKKVLCLLLITVMLIMCACDAEDPIAENSQGVTDNSANVDQNASQTESEPTAENSNPTLNKDDVTDTNKETEYVPDAKSAEEITEAECEALAYYMYADVLSIAKEFYGFPSYLFGTPGTKHETYVGIDQFNSSYREVRVQKRENVGSTIEFEADAEKLRELLNTYFSEELIELAFNLKHPCPIIEDDGVLYRMTHEPVTATTACDIAAGRIISRENGVVRYGFPIYFIDTDSDNTDDKLWIFGYMDFVYENNKWKVNDFRLSREAYDETYFPASKADVRMDDFFAIDDSMSKDGIEVLLDGEKKVTVKVDGKVIETELAKKSSKIRSIEKAGGSIFVSFLGTFGESETLVIRESDHQIAASFISDAYCITENGDWYYLTLNRENRTCDIFDKDGKSVYGIGAIIQNNTDEFGLHEIAPVEELKYEDGKFSVVYDLKGYPQVK